MPSPRVENGDVGVDSRDPLSSTDRAALLGIARASLVAHFSGSGRPSLPGTGRLAAPGAAFVTLREVEGELRGCIGTTRFERPLAGVVAELAVAAATTDRRFDEVREAELSAIRISISVLGPLEPARVDAIEIGRHGLVVRCQGASGLLLPQVASERGWDARTFLGETSRKAGLAPLDWQRKDATILWFTAESFGEPTA